jgi:uncharacterized protein RhaS with RHS repeats
MRARYYDPALGRFINQDPAKNGANWYAYCKNNPVGCTDPTGLMAEDPLIANAIGESMEGGSGGFALMVKHYIENKMYQIMSKYVSSYIGAKLGQEIADGTLESEGYMSWQVRTSACGNLKVAIDWSLHEGYSFIHWNLTKANGYPAGGSPNHAPLEAVNELIEWLSRVL